MALTVNDSPNWSGTLAVGSGSTATTTDPNYQVQGSSFQPQGAGSMGDGTVLSATTGGSTGGASVQTAPAKSQAQIDAEVQAAKDAAEASEKKASAKANIQQAIALYEAIFGDIDSLGKERLDDIEKDYAGRTNALTGDYLESIPTIQGNYAAIGNDSSTFQDRALGKAKSGWEKGIGDLAKAKGEDRTKIGSFVADKKAKYTADKASTENYNSSLDSVTDLGTLRDASNKTFNATAALQADRAGLMTDAGLKGQLTSLTNNGTALDNIRAGVNNILGSAATTSMKGAAVSMLVRNSGLSAEDQAKLLQEASSISTAETTPEKEKTIV